MVISSEFRGIGVGCQLIEGVIAYAHKIGIRQLKVRPVGRNEQAIRFFHEVGFSTIGYIELFQELDTGDSKSWKEGETIAGRLFKV